MGDGQLPQCATQIEGCVSGGKTKQALILMFISHDIAMISCHDRLKLWVRINPSSLKLLLPGILPSEKTNDEKTHIPYKRMLQQWRGAKCACLDVANVDELKKHYIKGREGGSANNCLLCKHKDLNSDPKNPQGKKCCASSVWDWGTQWRQENPRVRCIWEWLLMYMRIISRVMECPLELLKWLHNIANVLNHWILFYFLRELS